LRTVFYHFILAGTFIYGLFFRYPYLLFVKGEKGEHTPTLTEKQTVPPKYYTEASLLRAMETAGKLVDDEELRAALKENGIGRPSSRAGIIETLFKRTYIRRQRKNLIATETGIALIDTIHEKLLTSAELTGIWEKKLRDIEQKKYDEMEQYLKEIGFTDVKTYSSFSKNLADGNECDMFLFECSNF